MYISTCGVLTWLGAVESQLDGALYKAEADKLNQIIILMKLNVY